MLHNNVNKLSKSCEVEFGQWMLPPVTFHSLCYRLTEEKKKQNMFSLYIDHNIYPQDHMSELSYLIISWISSEQPSFPSLQDSMIISPHTLTSKLEYLFLNAVWSTCTALPAASSSESFSVYNATECTRSSTPLERKIIS